MKNTIKKLLLILLFVASFNSCSKDESTPSSTTTLIPQEGLNAWYSFNGNTNDGSGNGNNGSVNGATLTTDKFGASNKAYSFDGSSNNINLPKSFLNGSSVTKFAFYTRVKFNSITNSPNIWGKTLLNGNVNFYVTNNGVVTFEWVHSYGGVKFSKIYSDNNVITIDNWYDIVVVLENAIGRIYVNGNLITTNLLWRDQAGSTLSTTNVSSNCNFTQDTDSSKFGSRITSGVTGAYLNGTIDDFGIWNRALALSEVQDLYNLK